MRTQPSELQDCSRETSVTDQSVSIYCDAKAESKDVVEAFSKLAFAFPNLDKLTDTRQAGFIKVFDEAVKYSGMTKQQLYDATMNCICHRHQYGDLQIADIIDFDVKAKLYTYGWAVGRQGFVRSNLKRTDCTPWEYWWVKAGDLEKVNRVAERINN